MFAYLPDPSYPDVFSASNPCTQHSGCCLLEVLNRYAIFRFQPVYPKIMNHASSLAADLMLPRLTWTTAPSGFRQQSMTKHGSLLRAGFAANDPSTRARKYIAEKTNSRL